MLLLNVSNSLTELAKKLSVDLQQHTVSVFQPHYIVTQTDGMNNWLKLQIAQHNGIAANCIFIKPNDLIHHVYALLGGRYPSMLSAANLTWLVYNILGEKEFNDRYRNIANYYVTDSYDKDMKRLALAEKVTDLFDQYQIYRPEMIKEWNESFMDEISKDEWQKYLWKRAKELSGNTLPDKTIVREYILTALKNPEQVERLQRKMPSLYMFGLSVTTVYHLNIFNFLSDSIGIHYYLLNPSPSHYWFDDKSEKQLAVLEKKGFKDSYANSAGNPLLTNWGRVISDTFSLLFQNEQLLNAYEETGVTQPHTDTLLHKIQHDIFINATMEDRIKISLDNVQDSSVTINACYTIAREVEVLYNYLVHLVDKRKEALSPRDIVVMVTDIDAYAPYIKAVFSNAPYKFKYTIADESFSIGDSMINALKSVLGMNRQNFKAEEVLQLLDSTYIRKRFGLSNLQLIRSAVDMANIRFGMEGRKEDDTHYVSWLYGINRIMYGICMSGEERYEADGDTIYPLDMAEGSDSLELVRFTHFVQVIMDSINERKYDRTLSEWVEYVERVIQNLVSETEEDVEEEFNIIQSELQRLNAVNELLKEKISFEIFSYHFLQSISSTTRTGSFAGGGITCCSLIPMRSIPFKVVVLLGLNFDKFPRRENKIGFNLMEQKRMKGDRNVKDNDKHLFLETIMSAQEYLYMSYIGQSAKDNTTLPPSALLDELIGYIEDGYDKNENSKPTLVHRHPLHSFSTKYVRADQVFYNYLDDKTVAGRQNKNISKPLKAFHFEEVNISQLISFFKHPFKEYYNKVLSIFYEENPLLLSDTEIFQLDNLQKWGLKNELLGTDSHELESLKDKLVKTGGLPLKNMASIAMDETEKEVSQIRKLYLECIGEAAEEKMQIELNIDNTVIKGTLKNIFANKMVYVSYSKNEYKYMLGAYISYLAARAYSIDAELCFISATRQEIFTAIDISKEDANARLKELLQLYKKGHESILMFHPSLKIDPTSAASLDVDKFNKLLKDLFENYLYPCDDRYLLNEYYSGFFNQEGAVDKLKAISEILVEPIGRLFPEYFN